MLTSLFYVTGEFHRLLHRGRAEILAVNSFPKSVLSSNCPKFPILSLIINKKHHRANHIKLAQISFKLSRMRKVTTLNVQEYLYGK